ncbi:hypothetical protein [Pedobacter sp. ASV12]|uniref:hypothetical protein n=1 Tax=Pedobacter sp. ASV12 TaxID=2795120 RepID=UPI0018ED86A6|nr:hypothetical protein [Pedobacter sp. ASV12]
MKKTLIFFLLILSVFAYAQDAVQFERAKSYERLTLTKEGFDKLIKSIKYYHKGNSLDSTGLSRRYSISCEIGRNSESQTLNDFSQIEKLDLDGKDYTSLRINYLDLYQPISSIYLKFTSYDRSLSINGTDQQKVNALFRELDEQLTASEDFLSYINWPAILSTVLFSLFMCAQVIYFQIKAQDNNPQSLRLVKTIKSICIGYSLLWIIFGLSPLKIADLFPEFILTAEGTHWWDRYGNFIGVFSFLGTTLYAVIRFFSKLFISTRASASINTAAEQEAR